MLSSSSPTQNCWVEVGRGAGERFVQVLSPLPLRTSALLLATTQNSLGRLLGEAIEFEWSSPITLIGFQYNR
ncbi:hypothetical protein F8S12_06695 [Nostoc sp. WHI]|nr:hypothetical protein [Nostoc sp. WHI]